MNWNLLLLFSAIAVYVHAEIQPPKPTITNETVSLFNVASEFAETSKVSSESNAAPETLSLTELKLQAIEGATAESLKWSIGNFSEVVYASNDTAPEPIKGKPPKRAWLAKHKFDGVDFTLPTPNWVEDLSNHTLRRRLNTQVTIWVCWNSNRQRYVGNVQIWWGHTEGDATWACNTWLVGQCKNSCQNAYQVTKSHWNCYRQRDLKYVGQTSIWWGHNVPSGVWACNAWVSDCGNSPGGCLVTGAAHWDGNADWACSAPRQTDGCSGGLPHEREALRFACDQHDYCYYGPIKNDFWETYRHCTNLFYNEVWSSLHSGNDWAQFLRESWKFLVARVWTDAMISDPIWYTGNPVKGPGFGDGFQNRQLASDWECHLGKSKPDGYHVAPCQSGGGCLAGLSCYNCCDGDSGFQCNKAWWE